MSNQEENTESNKMEANEFGNADEKVAEADPSIKAIRENTQDEDVLDKGSNGTHTSDSGKEELSILTSKPGKPFPTDISSNAITIAWNDPGCIVDNYQIRYKNTSVEKSKWITKETDDDSTIFCAEGLQNSTDYVFKVQALHGDDMGPFSPLSDEIKTTEPLSKKLLENAQKTDQSQTSPFVYKMQTIEIPGSRNAKAMSKRVHVGTTHNPRALETEERTILIVGSTGSGKTTLVDALINYISGVNFEDNFRFSMIELEKNEQKVQSNQALSQTEWITVYEVDPLPGGRISFKLNIIDTPGFGDTRGIEQDNRILEHIRELFSAKDAKGVEALDAVCFIVKAPDARLTPTQTYIFSSILSIFGHDIGPNICALITFADGKDPVVLQSLKEAKVPFEAWFPFNNSALFAENLNLGDSSFTPMFWQLGTKSFDKFFAHLKTLTPKSLTLTKDVLQKRKTLQDLLYDIHPKINDSLFKIDQLKKEFVIFTDNEDAIKASANFTYIAEDSKIITVTLPPGTYVTNCTNCNTTCHSSCIYSDDEDKIYCGAMDSNNYCRVCASKCFWNIHRNHPYRYETVIERKVKSYEDVKKKFELASKKKLTVEEVIRKLGEEVVEKFEKTNQMMKTMRDIKIQLSKIALRPDPLSATDHIDLMISAEQMEKKIGFERRILVLKKFREFACTEDKFDELSKSMQSFQKDFDAEAGEKRSFIAKLLDISIPSFFKKKK